MDDSMTVAETIILREPWEVQPRLQELGLSKNKLLEVRDIALHEGSNATAFHAANASGTYSYHGGTWGLRDRFIGGDWILDRSNGVETIKNEKLKVIVAFSNVDLACVDSHIPQPRTKKGSGAERAMSVDMFGGLPTFAPKSTGEWQFFYLMVDVDGGAELTRPVVKGGRFTTAVERIYLFESGGDEGEGIRKTPPNDIIDFDPQIARK
jgi:hypothetical protein